MSIVTEFVDYLEFDLMSDLEKSNKKKPFVNDFWMKKLIWMGHQMVINVQSNQTEWNNK